LDFRDKIYALISLTPEAQNQLLVYYDINPEQLMLSVLNFCHAYQNLSVFGTLGFMSFLRQHLEVRTDELRNNILNLDNPNCPTSFAIGGTIRGRIETLHPGRHMEEVALRVRDKLPTLLQRHPLFLNERALSTRLELDPRSLAGTEPCVPVEISGIDQCLFVFNGNELRKRLSADSTSDLESPPSSSSPLFAGLASTRVNIGDEIWQFDRTPVAVVARRTPRGYTLVGRAFLLRDLSADCQNSGSRLEDQIVWVKDGAKHPQATPVIEVDLRGLHELMTWVNLDL
jgi:hypothetical protein